MEGHQCGWYVHDHDVTNVTVTKNLKCYTHSCICRCVYVYEYCCDILWGPFRADSARKTNWIWKVLNNVIRLKHYNFSPFYTFFCFFFVFQNKICGKIVCQMVSVKLLLCWKNYQLVRTIIIRFQFYELRLDKETRRRDYVGFAFLSLQIPWYANSYGPSVKVRVRFICHNIFDFDIWQKKRQQSKMMIVTWLYLCRKKQVNENN